MKKIFLIIAVIATAVALTGCTSGSEKENHKAKYIFLFIGDGMGATHVAVTESYLSHKAGKLGGEELHIDIFRCRLHKNLYRQGVAGSNTGSCIRNVQYN